MQRRSIVFTGPLQVEVRPEVLQPPQGNELLVRTEISAISAGTEMLLYRGEFPAEADAHGDLISRNLHYPTTYGYAAVGRVVQVGPAADPTWQDRLVFGFRPHGSHFMTNQQEVLPLPAGVDIEDAVFLPNMETAVNLILDTAPLLGESVLVLGQGVVGLLAASLLCEFPLECLATADRFATRRKASHALGVTAALDPASPGFRDDALRLTGPSRGGYDATLELTGNPLALNAAIALTAFSGRIVVGSWYGAKAAPVDFGGRFHRSRIALVASQVSSISPNLSGRWDKQRRFDVAWGQIRRLHPARWITHRFALDQAAEAYELLDQTPESAIQAVFTYS